MKIIHEAVLASDEASLEIELRGCFLERQIDARYAVLAPTPPRTACTPVRGVLHRMTGRRALFRVKKLVNSTKTPQASSSHTASGVKKKRQFVLSDPERSGPLHPRMRTGGLKRPYSELSARYYRDACSEKYRVKIHRLSFGIHSKTTTPDYDQLVKDMTCGSSEIPQVSQMSHKGAHTKGNRKGMKGKPRWIPRLPLSQLSFQNQ